MERIHSNKILTVFIVCLGIVIAFWLSQRKTVVSSLNTENNNLVSVTSPIVRENVETNADWKKILVDTDKNNQKITNLTKNSTNAPEETTQTSQMAIDLFSQYLLLKKGSASLGANDAQKITDSVLSGGQYTSSKGALYLVSNLHVTGQTDNATLTKYRDAVNLSLKNRSTQIKTDPASIVTDATKSQNEKDLQKLDPIIDTAQGFVNDFLDIRVPGDAVKVHLALLNSFSNLLADLQGMRALFSDPVRSLASLGQYKNHVLEFYTALTNMNSYFSQKGL